MRPVIVALALLFHLSGALWIGDRVPFPARVDELQHVSYVREMARAPAVFPRFERLRTLDPEGRGFTEKGNYLNHPSPYYHLMALVAGKDGPAAASVRLLRLVNLGLSGLGVLLMLYGGLFLLPRAGAFATYAAVLVMFPKLAVVGGLVNNDNFGILAAGLCLAGLAGLHRGGGWRTGVPLGLGLALAGWTKLTVLVMAGLACLIAEALRIGSAPDRRRWPALGLGAAIGTVGLVPTIQNWLAYGRPLFIFVAADHNFMPVAARPPLDLFGHGVLFLHHMALKWAALEPTGAVQSAGLILAVGAMVATMAAWGGDRWQSGPGLPGPGPDVAARLLATAYG